MADSFRMGGNQLVEFGDLLKVNAKAMRLEMRREIEPIRNKMADEMRSRAGSEKIAATVKAGTRGTGNTVRLVFTAGGAGVPEARLRELGNKGSRSTTSFRHPVFAHGPSSDWEWATQMMHSFMRPTLDANRTKVPPALAKAVTKTWSHSQPPEGKL